MRIVYVEDEPDIRELTCLALRSIGDNDVLEFGSGFDLLQKADQTKDTDLLLLDVMMPKIDGKTLLHELRKKPSFAKIPVIFMTAKTMPTEVEELYQLGAIDVISKPFDPLTLSEEISSAYKNHIT